MTSKDKYFIVKILISDTQPAEVGWIGEMNEDVFLEQFKVLSGVDNIKILYTFEVSEDKYNEITNQ